MMTTRLGFATLSAALVLGCAHDNDRPASMPMTTSGALAAQPVSMPDVEAIAKERCDREARCANIGVERKYATREVCMEQVRSDNMNALTNASCPYGIDADKLRACLTEVRGERCGHPFDTLGRFNACQRQALCPR
jgi:hypothetical protein